MSSAHDPRINDLQSRLAAEQRKFILQAAEADMLPSSGALTSIAALEGALSAVDAMLDSEIIGVQPASRTEPPSEPKQGTPTASTGTVKWFNATKGFGFIQPDNGGPDAFVHISAVERSGMNVLQEGQKVAYELVADKRSGKQSVGNLQVLG